MGAGIYGVTASHSAATAVPSLIALTSGICCATLGSIPCEIAASSNLED